MTWKIPLVKPALPTISEIGGDLEQAFRSGRISNFGPISAHLETELAHVLGVTHCIMVNSATTALVLLLNTLPPNSDVIVPSFTFIPSVQAVLWNGLNPVFADIDLRTLTISPGSVRSMMSANVSAILSVNAFGVPGHIDELTEIAREWGCQLYFDSAHGLGSKYRGRLVGRFGNAEVFSFGPTKVLTCGEGGLIATNDTQIARNILDRRNYGFVYHRETDANYIRHDSKNLGLNGKMTEMGALVGLWALPGLESYVKRRQYIARLYREHLDGVSGLAFQHIHTDVCSNFKDFVVIIDDSTVDGGRNAVREHLRCHGIETASYFYPPVHELSMFRDSAFRSDVLTNTEVISKKIVSLPMHHSLTENDIEEVCRRICEVLGRVRA